MVFGPQQEDGSFEYCHGADTTFPSHLKAGRGISTETYELDDVCPLDDIGSGLCTPLFTYHTL